MSLSGQEAYLLVVVDQDRPVEHVDGGFHAEHGLLLQAVCVLLAELVLRCKPVLHVLLFVRFCPSKLLQPHLQGHAAFEAGLDSMHAAASIQETASDNILNHRQYTACLNEPQTFGYYQYQLFLTR